MEPAILLSLYHDLQNQIVKLTNDNIQLRELATQLKQKVDELEGAEKIDGE